MHFILQLKWALNALNGVNLDFNDKWADVIANLSGRMAISGETATATHFGYGRKREKEDGMDEAERVGAEKRRQQ